MKTLFKKAIPLMLAFLTFQVFATTSTVTDYSAQDKTIVSSIEKQIARNPEISSVHVALNSLRGKVVLIGTVDTEAQASDLVEIAQSTPGVTDVITTNLKVKDSNQPLADTIITAKVKGLFLRDKLFTNKDISVTSVKVETKNGVVHLTGTADSATEVKNAVKAAKTVKGVKKVKSYIKISNK